MLYFAIIQIIIQLSQLLEIEGFAFYWNPKSKLFASYEEVVRLLKFQSEIATKTKVPDGYNYSNITKKIVNISS
jgi:hypothetical protein